MAAYQEVEKYDGWENSIEAIEGLFNLLKKTHEKSVKLGVVTSDHRDKAASIWKCCKSIVIIRVFWGATWLKKGSPFPDMVYKSCDEIGLHPVRALIIGDSNGDMVLGKNSNMLACIGITSKIDNTEHPKDADHVIKNYDSITL